MVQNKSYILLILLVVMPILLLAQKTPLISVGFSGNSYNGELSSYSNWTAGFQASWVFNTKRKLSGSLHIGLTSVSGEDRSFNVQSNIGDPNPNTFVKTNLLFINYAAKYSFVQRDRFSAYLSQGIGFARFTPNDEFGNNLEDQDDTRNVDETYRNISLILPTFIGVQYLLSNGLGLSFEFGLQNTTSDYLDNISELGDSGSDNIMSTRLHLLIPFNR